MIIRPSDIKLTIEQVAGSDTVLVTEVREVKKYDAAGNRTDTPDGFRYTAVAPAKKYAEFPIKTSKAFVTPEQLAAAKDGVVKVRVKGFVGRFYRVRKDKDVDYAFTSTAESLEVVAQ